MPRKRPAPTPEQVEASKARRQALYQLSKQLSAMTSDALFDLALRSPVSTCEGHPLSPFNQCLVALQCPTATIVGGLRQWQRHGRNVTKGSHGYGIWVPRRSKEDPAPTEVVSEDQRFLLVTVFDILQTHSEREVGDAAD